MLKEINRRYWTEHQNPHVEIVYKCEYGVIWSAPKYEGGGWEQAENRAYANALAKYKELLKKDNKLIEA